MQASPIPKSKRSWLTSEARRCRARPPPNKTGASGNIAGEFAARSDPDGYTIYNATLPHATSRYLYRSLGYDPVADFASVTLIGLYPLMMVVPNSSPAHSVGEFIAYAKVNKLSYAK